MEIKFKVDADRLNKALKIVSVISPVAKLGQDRGFLFAVGGDVCRVYSQGDNHSARSSFPISEVEGEGSFMFPADYINMFTFVSGLISVTATLEGNAFKVHCTFGASGDIDRVTFDPRSIIPNEQAIQAAMTQEPKTFNIKILQTALSMAKPFVAKPNDTVPNDCYRTIQVFGDEDPELAKRANGYLLSSNGIEAFYFHSSAFMGKGLAIPQQNLSLLETFMSQSEGELRLYKSKEGDLTYIVNSNDDVVGWPPHTSTHSKFSYYAKTEPIAVTVDAQSMLHQLYFMKAGLGSDKDKKKIRFHFDPVEKIFWFSSVEEGSSVKSLPVPVKEVLHLDMSKISGEMASNVDVYYMLHIFEGIKGEWAEFRLLVMPPNEKRTKDLFMFRTFDSFLLSEDGTMAGSGAAVDPSEKVHECKVTRFAPGMD